MKASPLVILLVTLVVVLVVMSAFSYISGRGADGLQTPAGAFTRAEALNNTTAFVEFGPIAWDTGPSEIRIVIESSMWSAEYAMPANDQSGPLVLDRTLGVSYSGNITSVIYSDRAQNEIVNTGDYITITLAREALESEAFIVSMIYVPSGAPVASIILTW
jgi:hypothetical protein